MARSRIKFKDICYRTEFPELSRTLSIQHKNKLKSLSTGKCFMIVFGKKIYLNGTEEIRRAIQAGARVDFE